MNCILFISLLSIVLLNKSGLVRAKPGNFILKSLNRCFSNYYQVRTWPVFAETVTYIIWCRITWRTRWHKPFLNYVKWQQPTYGQIFKWMQPKREKKRFFVTLSLPEDGWFNAKQKHLGCKKCKANHKQHASRQVQPKGMISVEAKKPLYQKYL